MYVIQIYKSMLPMINGLNSKNILCTDSNNIFPVHYELWGKFLKRIVANLYCTKCNEINIFL